MSRARRLFAEALPEQGGEVVLDAEVARHARVLRLLPGDAVELFDGQGRRSRGRLVASTGARLVCEVEAPVLVPPLAPRVHLILGVPKAGALDDAIRAATEAGASSIHLAVAARTASSLETGRIARRMERLARVVREAARQCERDDRPALHPPAPFDEVLTRSRGAGLRLVASPRSASSWPPRAAEDAWIAVGPEGGFAASEEEAFAAEGFAPISLGPYVLRAVTAAPVAVAIVRDRLGDRPDALAGRPPGAIR